MVDLRLLPGGIDDDRSRALAAAIERLDDIDRTRLLVYHVDTVDASALPHLVEQFHLTDYIDDVTSEPLMRRLLKRAIALHRHKGTRWAVETALEAAGVTAEITEWWQTDPPATPNTFQVIAFIRPEGGTAYALDATLIARLERMVRASKRHSQGVELALGMETETTRIRVGLTTLSGETVTVHPHAVTELSAHGAVPKIGVAHYGVETTTLYPK